MNRVQAPHGAGIVLQSIKTASLQRTAGRNWRTTSAACSSVWYSATPTLGCVFTTSQRRSLPAHGQAQQLHAPNTSGVRKIFAFGASNTCCPPGRRGARLTGHRVPRVIMHARLGCPPTGKYKRWSLHPCAKPLLKLGCA